MNIDGLSPNERIQETGMHGVYHFWGQAHLSCNTAFMQQIIENLKHIHTFLVLMLRLKTNVNSLPTKLNAK